MRTPALRGGMVETLQLNAPYPRQKALQVGEGHLEGKRSSPEERAAVENDIGVGVLIPVADLVWVASGGPEGRSSIAMRGSLTGFW